jgi:hypothetical protein
MIKSGDGRYPYLVPNFRGNAFQVISIQCNVGYMSVYIAFIVLQKEPSIPSFFRAFIMKECWIFSKAFSAFIEINM